MKKKLSLLLISIWLTACGQSIPTVKDLPFPNADYEAIVQIDQRIAAISNGEEISNMMWYAQEGDSSLQEIVFPEDPSCVRTAYIIPETLPDGRLQLWKLCDIETEELITKTITYLMAYDWQTRSMAELAGPVPLGSSVVSWNPDGTRAIAYLYDGFASGTLYWIWKGGFGPLDLVITDKGKSWNLKDDYPDFRGTDTGQTGDVGRAAWSPDGRSIAFFASPDAIGITGSDSQRFYVDYKLYLMDANQLEPHAMLDKIYFPYIIKWSPDSKHIAFIGQYGYFKQDGIWLYTLANNSVINISNGNYRDILWTSDGKGLIAIYCKQIHNCSQIDEYDLTSVVRP